MTKSEVIEKLGLQPLSIEGGWFKEVYRAGIPYPKKGLPVEFKSEKYVASTSIYYMLSSDDKSSMHSVPSDETWHFYRGGDESVFIELLVVSPEGSGKLVRLGSKIEHGQVPQFTVPAGYWMGARINFKENVNKDFAWALSGATVSPSFEYADFVKGDASLIASMCPEFSEMILMLS